MTSVTANTPGLVGNNTTNGPGTNVPPPATGDGGVDSTGGSTLSVDDMAELQKLLQSLMSAVDENGGTGDGSAPSGPPGAPALEGPQPFDNEDMAIACQNLMTKCNDLQMSAENSMLKLHSQQSQDAHKKAIEQIHEIAKKMAAAAKKQKILGVLGIIGKVFAVIAAVAMTVMTGGAAAPVAAALLVYAVADLALTVADKISQAKGGPNLSLDHLMQAGITKLAEAAGHSPEEAEKIGKWATMAIQITIAVAGIACGASGFISDAGPLINLSETAEQVVKLLSGAGMVLNGANMVAQGGLTISAAMDDKDVAHARSIQMREQAVIDVVNTYINSSLDHMKALVDQQAQVTGQVSDILQSGHETRVSVTHATV